MMIETPTTRSHSVFSMEVLIIQLEKTNPTSFNTRRWVNDIKTYYTPNKRFFGAPPLTEQGGICINEELSEENGRPDSCFSEEGSNELLHRRDRHDIIMEILKTAMGGRKKTYIMYKARLSHSQLKLYLELLNRNGMIMNNDGVFKTTPKGLTFIKEFESINFLFRQ
jgi:predicted transcriptional regulator